jgi:hypothetical protein
MPWELTGNPDTDIGPNNFLGTLGRDPLRIKTFASGDALLSNRPTGLDVMFITPSNPDQDSLGSVGVRTNSPRDALHVNGSGLFEGHLYLNVEANVPLAVPLLAGVPGELSLGGIRTSIRGFDGAPDEPPTSLFPPGGPTAQAGLRRGPTG